ncbi:MAG: AAC(3) family N-acetyltransferase [Minicystis sp.]
MRRADVVDQILALGVQPGGVLLVHTAFSKIAPIDDGPRGLIDALLAALGPDGTLVMPSMSDDDEHVFDPAATPCRGMGIVADTFWRLPGILRSNSPHAFAATGPRAEEITADHPVEVPHGPDSPVGRVRDLDGQVLLLGVGQDGSTTIHLAEMLAGVRYRRAYSSMVLVDGVPRRVEYTETDHCCERFALVDEWLEERRLQRRGPVGHGTARLARSRDVVRVAVEHLRVDETAFLHPPGVDEECDDARASLEGLGPWRDSR